MKARGISAFFILIMMAAPVYAAPKKPKAPPVHCQAGQIKDGKNGCKDAPVPAQYSKDAVTKARYERWLVFKRQADDNKAKLKAAQDAAKKEVTAAKKALQEDKKKNAPQATINGDNAKIKKLEADVKKLQIQVANATAFDSFLNAKKNDLIIKKQVLTFIPNKKDPYDKPIVVDLGPQKGNDGKHGADPTGIPVENEKDGDTQADKASP